MQGSTLPGDPLRQAWFEAVYALVERDPSRVPWANLAPHPLTQAFDLVGAAVAWAKQRFPATRAWRQGFDLDHECYTLEALSPVLLPQTLAALGSLLAPGGKLLIVARARDEASETKGPPWPLPPSIFEDAKRQNLEPVSIEDILAAPGVTARHWRALLRRAE